MIYRDSFAVIEKMNRLYSKKEPFFFIINHEKTEAHIVEDPLNQKEVLFHFPDGNNDDLQPLHEKETKFSVIPNGLENYQNKFSQLQKSLQNGEVALANLTEKTEIKTNLSLEEIFHRSRSLYRIYLPGHFVCFSPERFIKISGGKISTNPMKGTIDADIPDAARVLLQDKKEIAEHTATVNLLTGELRTVSKQVHTTRFRYIDTLETNRKKLLQTSSEIVGVLPDDYPQKIGEIIFSLLPGGSITGSPKKRAVEILREIEGQERGYYCGIAGYFDGEAMDTAVLIRFIEQDGGRFYFRSGGGITINSNCEKEYEEMLNKIYLSL